jgi:hypothetical protein
LFALENYFNYFTEVEECFRKCRGTPTLLSTLDWALVECWKEAGIPLEAVLMGIDRTFHKFAKRPQRFRKVNGLAYCTQEVLRTAEELNTELAEGGPRPKSKPVEPPFSRDEVRNYLIHCAEAVGDSSQRSAQDGAGVVATDLADAAADLRAMVSQSDITANLEELENRLTSLEEKLTACLTRLAPLELLTDVRRGVDKSLVSCRQKMTGPQIESLHRQLMKKRLFERYQIPRLSLFYL